MAMSVPVFACNYTEDDAVRIALKNAKLSKSQVHRLESEVEDNGKTYEIDFIRNSNNADYEYEISAKTGKILEKTIEYKYKHKKSNKKIGRKAARKKVAKASGIRYSVVRKGTCKYIKKRGEGKYIVKFKSGGYRYVYKLLARNGKIIKMEMELIR
jgi:uncharacterized membrane protein YkoI